MPHSSKCCTDVLFFEVVFQSCKDRHPTEIQTWHGQPVQQSLLMPTMDQIQACLPAGSKAVIISTKFVQMEADPHDSDETNTELASNIAEHFHALGFLRFWSRAGLSDVEGSLLGLSIMCTEALMAKRGVRDSIACSITCACYRPSRGIPGLDASH